ncbi:unnamed protein product [Alopecurus aequalis]
MATSPARRRRSCKKTETTITEIPDHLLAEIFLRLPAEEDLARASAACVTFRRLATDGSFLPCFRRRFRHLQSPPLLGFLDYRGFHHAVPPHPSAPAARALALAADFSFSFLPSHCPWIVEDVRDGRVLLGRDPGEEDRPPVTRELVVCDPLHRRYVLLPSVPEALASSVELDDPLLPRPWCERFLVPPAGEEPAAEGAAFSVICVVHCQIRLVVFVFVFSSSTGQWRAAASKCIGDLYHASGKLIEKSTLNPTFVRRHYAYGCFYWESTMFMRKEVLVLDTQTMVFSLADLPSQGWGTQGIAIVEAGGGRIGMFSIHAGISGVRFLCYTVMHNQGEWQMVRMFSLGSGNAQSIKAATERHLLLECPQPPCLEGSSFRLRGVKYISMDVKTLQLGRVCVKPHSSGDKTRIYSSFPPSFLSSPTV